MFFVALESSLHGCLTLSRILDYSAFVPAKSGIGISLPNNKRIYRASGFFVRLAHQIESMVGWRGHFGAPDFLLTGKANPVSSPPAISLSCGDFKFNRSHT